MLQIVRYGAVPSTPWKNGLGLTRQLAIHPPQATAESFEWRLSIAQLTGTAPFSRFADITRCLAVLEGVLTLQWAGGTEQRLTAQSPPVQFAGDAAVNGGVEAGPVLDLNLMWQPSRWQAAMTRLTAHAGARQLEQLKGMFMVCSLAEELHLRLAAAEYRLRRYDLLCVEQPSMLPDWGPLSVCEASSFDAYCIELRAR
jgi:environmental stress-induced protein Ves